LSPEKRAAFERLAFPTAGGQDARSIQPRGYEGPAPLSFAQQRLWFLDQLMPGTTLFNLSFPVPVYEAVDEGVLERSVNEVVSRHEALRTVFRVVDGEACQVLLPHGWLELRCVDLRGIPADEREAECVKRVVLEQETPFDLAEGPLLRTSLLRTGDAEYVFLLTMHHIVSDAWSLDVFWSELAAVWDCFALGEPNPLPRLPIQYADFCVWERERLRGPVLDELVSYWKEQLSGAPAVELEPDRPRPAVLSGSGAVEYLTIPVPVLAELRELGAQERATLFMVLVAAFETLLCRYTGQEDVVIGTFSANRGRAEIEGLIGFFVNTLVLRGDLSGAPSFRELLGRVRQSALEAYAHQDLPFARLVQELSPDRDLSRNPVFQIAFQLLNTGDAENSGRRSIDDVIDRYRATSIFDLTCTTWECVEGLAVELEYNTDLFDRETIERFGSCFAVLLRGIAKDPDQGVHELPLWDDEQRREVVEGWNRTEVVWGSPEETVVSAFAAQVERAPDRVACWCGTETETYSGLDRRAEELAGHLRSLGVVEERVVGMCLNRSIDMVVAMLAILKAGGAYLPLDPSYPSERLGFMLADSGAGWLVTETAVEKRLVEPQVRVVCVDRDRDTWAGRPPADVREVVAADAPAYVLYTSGSTGQPKAVVGHHRGIVNVVRWLERAFPYEPDEVACQKTALSFVDSVWELFGPLLAGVPFVVLPEGLAAEPRELIDALAAHRVTRIVLVPSLLEALLETRDALSRQLPDLRLWMLSGEALSGESAARLRRRLPKARLVNLYGQSEASAVATAGEVDATPPGGVPIGRPIANTRCYVLDRHLQPVPPGIPGELYVGGSGLARGYLNRAAQTARSFVPDPFGRQPGSRLYRTGDLVRHLADGQLEFLGRVDDQVKLRGFRIEPAEIEAVMTRHRAVSQAAVALRDDGAGDPRLVAYLVSDPASRIAQDAIADELRQALRRSVPEYMIPSDFVVLPALPRTSSGKLDRLGLPAPRGDRALPSHTYVAPSTPTEAQLASIWSELLGVEKVGRNDSFFDLGGHSLLGVRVLSRIRDAFDVDIPLRAIFESPTIAQLAHLVIETHAHGSGDDTPAIVPLSRADHTMALALGESFGEEQEA
jgi:amino acid adenylation domain-containing protein